MSDFSQGPGWWLASDGRWYPPSPPLPSAPLPGGPGAPKPWWKQTWFIAVSGVVLLLIVMGAIGAVTKTEDESEKTTARSVGSGAAALEATMTLPRVTTTAQRPTTTVSVETLKAEYDDQVAKSCAAAVGMSLDQSDDQAAQAQASGYASRWDRVAGRTQFVADVKGCAASERNARLDSECAGEAPVELLNRNPDQFKGQCFQVVVSIVQFDQGTGPCAFRVKFDTTAREYNFQYRGENGLVGFPSPCPELDPVGTDDVLRIRAVVLGGIKYETTLGGQTQAVRFSPRGEIEILENR